MSGCVHKEVACFTGSCYCVHFVITQLHVPSNQWNCTNKGNPSHVWEAVMYLCGSRKCYLGGICGKVMCL